MIFVACFDRFFVEFMFNFVSWPGRPDKRRAHTEHIQRWVGNQMYSFPSEAVGLGVLHFVETGMQMLAILH